MVGSLGRALAPPSLSSAPLRPTSPPFLLLLWLLLLPDLASSDPPGCPPQRTPSLPGQESCAAPPQVGAGSRGREICSAPARAVLGSVVGKPKNCPDCETGQRRWRWRCGSRIAICQPVPVLGWHLLRQTMHADYQP